MPYKNVKTENIEFVKLISNINLYCQKSMILNLTKRIEKPKTKVRVLYEMQSLLKIIYIYHEIFTDINYTKFFSRNNL